jgi:mono/diheme cytochrome c family protein
MKQNRFLKISVLSFLVLAPLFAFQNCSNTMAPMDLDEQAAQGNPTGPGAAESMVLGVLNNKCLSCHGPVAAMGGIDYITDVPSLKYYRVAIPGQAAASPIYTVLSNNDHSSLLAASEVALIYNWVQSGMEASTPGTAPTIIPLDKTYKSIYRNIISQKCITCHNGAGAPNGLNYATYSTLMATGAVKPGDANGSLFVQAVNRQPGQTSFMPKGGARLSAQELQVITDWVNAGAMDN